MAIEQPFRNDCIQNNDTVLFVVSADFQNRLHTLNFMCPFEWLPFDNYGTVFTMDSLVQHTSARKLSKNERKKFYPYKHTTTTKVKKATSASKNVEKQVYALLFDSEACIKTHWQTAQSINGKSIDLDVSKHHLQLLPTVKLFISLFSCFFVVVVKSPQPITTTIRESRRKNHHTSC